MNIIDDISVTPVSIDGRYISYWLIEHSDTGTISVLNTEEDLVFINPLDVELVDVNTSREIEDYILNISQCDQNYQPDLKFFWLDKANVKVIDGMDEEYWEGRGLDTLLNRMLASYQQASLALKQAEYVSCEIREPELSSSINEILVTTISSFAFSRDLRISIVMGACNAIGRIVVNVVSCGYDTYVKMGEIERYLESAKMWTEYGDYFQSLIARRLN
jgi:hypothetical protein